MNTEFKGTPGPWSVAPLDGKYYGTLVAMGTHHSVTVWTPDHYAEPFASEREVEAGWLPEYGHDHVEDVRSYANARLIASAPELLEALRSLSATVDAAITAGDWEVDGACDPDLNILRARAAIAKALGQEE